MKKITEQQLVDHLNATKGAGIVGFDLESAPAMRKKGNPFIKECVLDCVKCVSLSGFFGWDYENSVRNQLIREGKGDEADALEAKPLAWGYHCGNMIAHKGAYYIQIKVENSNNPIYTHKDEKPIVFDKVAPFLSDHFLTEVSVLNGEIVEDGTEGATVESQWLKRDYKSSTQEKVEKEIIVRTAKIANIKRIRMGGDEYEIDHTVPAIAPEKTN